MFKLLYTIIVIAFGFISAAVINTLSSFKNERIGEVALIDHPHRSLSGFALLMFTGPYLLAKNGLVLWQNENISKGLVVFCFLLALLWGFFQGVIITQILMLSGLLINPGI